MTNRLRTEVQEQEEAEAKLIVEEKPVKVIPDNVFTQLFTKGFVSTEAATNALPFVLYIAFLGMIYIGNRHLAEKNIHDIDKIGKEVKEQSWAYKSTKADLAFKSMLTEVSKRTDTLGLKQSLQPPQKITVKEGDDQ
jgi:hypothetical protein